MIRILIADDHRIFRQGLAMLMADEPDMELVAEASNGVEALALIRELKPDVAVLDLSMPRPDGIEIARQLSTEGNPLPCLILTMKDEPAIMRHAMLAGAKGYLVKESTFEDFVVAVRHVSSGRLWFDAEVTSAQHIPENAPPLTAREREILSLVAAGLPSKLIAERLYLSQRTVENHRHNIMKKLNIHNVASLVRNAEKFLFVR